MINPFLPPHEKCTHAQEFHNQVGFHRGEYKSTNGRNTPCIYWCTNNQAYAQHIADALNPKGRADIRSLIVYGGCKAYLAFFFAAEKDKATKDAIFQECLKCHQLAHQLHTIDITFLVPHVSSNALRKMVKHYNDLHCIIPIDLESGINTTTYRLAYKLTSLTCQHTAITTRKKFAKDYPYFMEKEHVTDPPSTSAASRTTSQSTNKQSQPLIHREDRVTNWCQYQSTQITRNKPVIFDNKIYLIYNGMKVRHSVGLYPSWHLASQHILGYVAVHGTVKKHEGQKAWPNCRCLPRNHLPEDAR
eukprot:scaffold310978_cov55-Attheya_sp.AAC.2